MDKFFYKIIKFSLVGCSGLIIDFGITYLLIEKGRKNKYLANATGFFCAATSNFMINKTWTFEDRQNAFFLQYTLYFCIALVGLTINHLTLYLSHHRFNIGFYYSKGIATVAVTLWNFTLNYLITFR